MNCLAALAAVGLDAHAPSGRVLVVDDDPRAVALVSKHLQAAGFTTVAAYGGQEALDRVRSQPPELMNVDLIMPGISGFDVVKAMRADAETATLPIIVLTADRLTDEDRARLRGQVQRVMEKSEFQPAGLLAEVTRALARPRLLLH